MHVVLVGAEFEENLALRYIHGALRREGHQVRQVVFNSPDALEPAAHQIADSGADLVGYSMVFTARSQQFARLMERARQLGLDGFQVAGGHFAAFNARQLLRDLPALDAVALGEGEATLCRLCTCLDRPWEVPGLLVRGPQGQLTRTAAAPPQPLDQLAWPVRRQPPHRFLGLPIVNLLGSRGCTHGCAFCSIVAWHRLCGGPRLRLRQPEQIGREMASLYRDGVRIFNFHDDNFLLPQADETLERLVRLERCLKRHDVGRIAFAIKCRPDEVQPAILDQLQRMGLFRVFLGVEAGAAATLRQLGRGQSVEHNLRALQLLRQRRLHVCFNLLLLNPDSTLEQVAANVDFLRHACHTPMNFCRTEVYAGTPLERRLRRRGALLGDYWGYHYRIADAQAQQLFELMLPVFRQRNFSQRGLHHRSMQLDYEHQLLQHFHGTQPALRQQVKQLVRRINLSSVELLDEMVQALRQGPLPAARAQALERRWHQRVERDDQRLEREASQLLQLIRTRAAASSGPLRPASSQLWARRAAAATLAATLSLGGACKKVDGGPTGHGSQVFEMVAQPLEGDPELLRQPLSQVLLPELAQQLPEPAPVTVTVQVDGQGEIERCTARREPDGKQLRCPELFFTAGRQGALRRRFRVRFSKHEVARARVRGQLTPLPDAGAPRIIDARVPQTQMSEMAPPPKLPPQPPKTQMMETVPVPKEDTKKD